MDFEFPEMDGKDKDVSTHRPGSGNGFKLPGLGNLPQYQNGNREYYPFGIGLFWLVMVLHSIIMAYVNYSIRAQTNFNWLHYALSVFQEALLLGLLLIGYALVDRYVLKNQIDWRYTMGKYGWWSIYGLVFGIIGCLYLLVTFNHTAINGLSFKLTLFAHVSLALDAIAIFHWWTILTPLVIFLLQRKFVMAGRMLGSFGYLVILLVLWGGFSLTNQLTNIYDETPNPMFENVQVFKRTVTQTTATKSNQVATKPTPPIHQGHK